MAADDCRICANTGAATNAGREEFRLATNMRSREKHVGKNHTGATKHVVFQSDTFVNRNVILDFTAISNEDPWPDHYVLSNDTTGPDTAPRKNMAEMPYSAFFADSNVFIDDGGGMYEN